MATTSPAGIYYRVAGEANSTYEAQQLAMATSINKAIGLIPVIPTSISVGSGTGSVDAFGLVTFTGASTVSLNGVFSSAYTNYELVVDFYNANVDADVRMRLRAAGTDYTGATYKMMGVSSSAGSAVGISETSVSSGIIGRVTAAYGSAVKTTLYNPYKAETKRLLSNSVDGDIYRALGVDVVTNSLYDGITLLNFTMTGTAKIYGYN